MTSYAFKRRSFLGLLGGAFGLRALLQNIEAHAQGMAPPQRLLVMHRPVGSYRAAWLCQGSGTDFTLSRMLEPFAALKSQAIVLDGLDIEQSGPGGGHEKGKSVLDYVAHRRQRARGRHGPAAGGGDPARQLQRHHQSDLGGASLNPSPPP